MPVSRAARACARCACMYISMGDNVATWCNVLSGDERRELCWQTMQLRGKSFSIAIIRSLSYVRRMSIKSFDRSIFRRVSSVVEPSSRITNRYLVSNISIRARFFLISCKIDYNLSVWLHQRVATWRSLCHSRLIRVMQVRSVATWEKHSPGTKSHWKQLRSSRDAR